MWGSQSCHSGKHTHTGKVIYPSPLGTEALALRTFPHLTLCISSSVSFIMPSNKPVTISLSLSSILILSSYMTLSKLIYSLSLSFGKLGIRIPPPSIPIQIKKIIHTRLFEIGMQQVLANYSRYSAAKNYLKNLSKLTQHTRQTLVLNDLVPRVLLRVETWTVDMMKFRMKLDHSSKSPANFCGVPLSRIRPHRG